MNTGLFSRRITHAAFFINLICLLILLYINNERLVLEKQHSRAHYIQSEITSLVQPVFLLSGLINEGDFLADWLKTESDRPALDRFLGRYTENLGCDAIDLASTRTETVYQSAGTQVKMERGNERDAWYFNFMEDDALWNTELFYNSLQGVLYMYYNMKLTDGGGHVLGVLGFLFSYSTITDILSLYEDDGFSAYIINPEGEILIHSDQSRIGDIVIYDYYGKLQEADCEIAEDKGRRISSDHILPLTNLNLFLVYEQNRRDFLIWLWLPLVLALLGWGVLKLITFRLIEREPQGEQGPADVVVFEGD